MSLLFITEKPSVAQEYRKVLKIQAKGNTDGYVEGESVAMGGNVVITWAIGHLVSICPPEMQNPAWKAWEKESLPMFPKTFRYAPVQSTQKQFGIVRNLFRRPDIECIYYAGDSGREGIYIQALIRNQIFKNNPSYSEKVVWIDSYTEESILNGIQTARPYADYIPMIESGYARAVDDWLIGMNLSRAFTISLCEYGEKIAVGRVMTPTLAMVVNRQDEIDSFKKVPYFGVRADEFAVWKASAGTRYYDSPHLYNETGFRDKAKAEDLCRILSVDMALTAEDVSVQTKTQYAPYLFNLADLQAYCTKAFRMSPADTLKTVQSLYEKKYTTYPRTDSRFLTKAVQKELLQKHGYLIPNRYVDDAKVTDHYAVIPTFQGNTNALNGTERSVYEAVLKRFMDTMKPPFIYDSVSIRYIHSTGEKFFEKYKIVRQTGYRNSFIEEEDISTKEPPKTGDVIQVHAFRVHAMETKPPTPYTTGSLILAMEKAGRLIEDEELREQIRTCGIGTSATRAEIIDKLIRNGLFKTDSRQKVIPTEYGKKVVHIVEKYDSSLVSPEKTAEMEQQLQLIAESRLSKARHEEDVKTYIRSTVSAVLKDGKEDMQKKNMFCPHCGGEVVRGRYGWYCRNRCGMNISKVFGHELTNEQVDALLSGQEVRVCIDKQKTTVFPRIVTHEYNGKTYFNWETSSDNKKELTAAGKCPHCGGEVIKGKYGWYCRNKCGMNIGKIFGTCLADEDVRILLTGHRVTIRDGNKTIIVYPAVSEEEWKGKTYFNWKTEQADPALNEAPVMACPYCGGEAVKGKYGWYCKSKCGMNFHMVYGYKMSSYQVEKLLSGQPVSFTYALRPTTVLPEVAEKEWNGKTYINWKVKDL